ncbi:MAG: sphinganine-1-phosphate aldolase [Candidatus Magnetoglobus multicellularis str. Araruama]|uniref:Sphinganine-1-phosphate aldolase n=1 Tax=Candidatus Magnetoglobus multicellularis str. Araruama TaxID=890399 RepID=A0A1V1PAI2_9BACT|nr:MAG: sphinganine-1-phosphate aldolase [Candidatus Magnetoglobus multicellularis str. Araruama]
MDILTIITDRLQRIHPSILQFLENNLKFLDKYIKHVPFVEKYLEQEYDGIMDALESQLKPYKDQSMTFAALPVMGKSHDDILLEMESMAEQENGKWKHGYVSGAVYHGDNEHIAFLNQVYAINSQSNPLHSDIWPSANKFEAEIVSMTANMLGAGNMESSIKNQICGTVTSGGTESILLAMKTYRDRALVEKGITSPEMIVPVTAHAAFDKAAQYFCIKKVSVPVDQNFAANIGRVKKAITKNTIVIVGSAPSFPHGIIDPIEQLSEIARKRQIGFHTDACLGGFILPWAEKLGYPIPHFDFRLPGVTSISADTHKYGYAAKGTSVILYRGPHLRHYQYFTITDWPGGLYFSPTFAGSRSGALSATCWAAMIAMGEKGYLDATAKILETATWLKEQICNIPNLKILGNPLWVIAFTSPKLDIYRIMDQMTQKGWALNGLHKPSCIHICVTLRHTQDGVAKQFIEDLNAAIDYVKLNPTESKGMAPVYGLAATLPVRSIVGDMLKKYMDVLYNP